MAKFKRRTKIVTRDGNEYITDLYVSQVHYFLTANEFSRGGNAFMATEYVNGTGHVKSVAIARDDISQVVDLLHKSTTPPNSTIGRKVRMSADGQIHAR